jgi:hypothetical protein
MQVIGPLIIFFPFALIGAAPFSPPLAALGQIADRGQGGDRLVRGQRRRVQPAVRRRRLQVVRVPRRGHWRGVCGHGVRGGLRSARTTWRSSRSEKQASASAITGRQLCHTSWSAGARSAAPASCPERWRLPCPARWQLCPARWRLPCPARWRLPCPARWWPSCPARWRLSCPARWLVCARPPRSAREEPRRTQSFQLVSRRDERRKRSHEDTQGEVGVILTLR